MNLFKTIITVMFTISILVVSNCAYEQTNGNQDSIYEYDGTIRNVSRGSSNYSSRFYNAIVYNDELFFSGDKISADENADKHIIYKFDGNSIKNLNKGTSDYQNYFWSAIVYKDKLYFCGTDSKKSNFYSRWFECHDDEIFNAVYVNDSDYHSKFEGPVVHNDYLYFIGINSESTHSLYRFDGTTVIKVYENIHGLINGTEFNGKLYFEAFSVEGEVVRYKLYQIDGTAVTLVDTTESGQFNYFRNPIISKGILYFKGEDSDSHFYIYALGLDGEVTKLNTVDSDYRSGFEVPVIYNDELYFIGYSLTDYPALFSYDGENLVEHTKDAGISMDFFDSPVVFNNKIYMSGYAISNENSESVSKPGIYTFDGSSFNVVNVGTSKYKSNILHTIVYSDRLYFQGDGEKVMDDFYMIDKDDTIKVVNKGSSGYSRTFTQPFIFNEKLYFQGTIRY